MPDTGYVFDEDGARRVARAVNLLESSQLITGRLPPRPGRGPAPNREQLFVQTTSSTATSGHYPGKLYYRDSANAAWIDPSITVWVVEANGGTLSTGTYYEAFASGPWTNAGDTRLACLVDLQGGSGGGGGSKGISYCLAGLSGGPASVGTPILLTIGLASQSETYISGGTLTVPRTGLYRVTMQNVLLTPNTGSTFPPNTDSNFKGWRLMHLAIGKLSGGVIVSPFVADTYWWISGLGGDRRTFTGILSLTAGDVLGATATETEPPGTSVPAETLTFTADSGTNLAVVYLGDAGVTPLVT